MNEQIKNKEKKLPMRVCSVGFVIDVFEHLVGGIWGKLKARLVKEDVADQ
jgi:hypothetical protein